MLAEYGADEHPAPQQALPQEVAELDSLLSRKADLEKLLQSERNRYGRLQRHTALLSLVGASLSADGWEDPVLTEALAQGLADLNAWLPPIEASFTVVTPGREQDLNTLAPQQVLAVATPWTETSEWRTAAVLDRKSVV